MSNIKLIETLYSSFKNKDYDLIRKLCADDLEWIQNAGFPNGAHHRGIDSVVDNVFKRFNDEWDYFKFEIEDMFESKDDSQVVVLGAYVGRHKTTQKEMKAAAVHLYEIENQKIKKFRQFADTAVIVAATKI